MPLYHFYDNTLVDPSEIGLLPLMAALKEKSAWNTFQKYDRTNKEAVEEVVRASQANLNLAWLRFSSVFGLQSKRPLADVNHLHETLLNAVGPDLMNKAGGTYLMYTIARMPQVWLWKKDEKSPGTDPVTGKIFYPTEYWVSPTYQPPSSQKASLSDLQARFNRIKI
jgi:hypothetical protein